VSLPQSNATLTSVLVAGAAEDYDQPSTPGAEKWAGRERVYLAERSDRVEEGDTTQIVVTRWVVVDGAMRIDWVQGDRLVVKRDGDAEVTVSVRAVERHRQPGLPSTTRLTLEDE